MKSANYKLPAYLMVLMSVIGFTLLCAANDWQINVLYVGLGFLGLFVLIYSILVLCSIVIKSCNSGLREKGSCLFFDFLCSRTEIFQFSGAFAAFTRV